MELRVINVELYSVGRDEMGRQTDPFCPSHAVNNEHKWKYSLNEKYIGHIMNESHRKMFLELKCNNDQNMALFKAAVYDDYDCFTIIANTPVNYDTQYWFGYGPHYHAENKDCVEAWDNYAAELNTIAMQERLIKDKHLRKKCAGEYCRIIPISPVQPKYNKTWISSMQWKHHMV